MSSSTTYRTVESLPAAVRAEVEAMLADNAPSAKLIPVLATDLIGRVRHASDVGIIPSVDAEALTRQLEGATNLLSLEATVAQLPVGIIAPAGTDIATVPSPVLEVSRTHRGEDVSVALEAGSSFILEHASTPTQSDAVVVSLQTAETLNADGVVIELPDRYERGGVEQPVPPRGSFEWEVTVLRARIGVAESDAAMLGMTVTEPLAEATRSLTAAEVAASSAHPELAFRHLAQVTEIIDDVDSRIEQALTVMETQRCTIAQAARVLEGMGFVVEAGADGPGLVARSSGGQRAEVQVGTDTHGRTDLTTSVIDPAHAVPLADVAAGDVCEPAVTTALEFHRTLESIDGLELGRVTTRTFPARGSNESDSAAVPPELTETQDDPGVRTRRGVANKQLRRFNQ